MSPKLKIGIDFGGCLSIHDGENTHSEHRKTEINMPGCLDILHQLKKDGHDLYLISFCGKSRAEETKKAIDAIIPSIFTKLFFVKDKKYKKFICEFINCDVMIDDNLNILVDISYFFEKSIAKKSHVSLLWYKGDPNFEDNSKTRIKNIHEVKTWTDIYEYCSYPFLIKNTKIKINSENTKNICQNTKNISQNDIEKYIYPMISDDPDHEYNKAQEIIQGLYLGPHQSSVDHKWLEEMDIKYNINLDKRDHLVITSDTCIDRFFIDIEDSKTCDIMSHFDKCNNYIDNVFESKGKVLVNCHAGISRSATIVAAYLIKKNKISPDEALKIIQEKRLCVLPNVGFLKQLDQYFDLINKDIS